MNISSEIGIASRLDFLHIKSYLESDFFRSPAQSFYHNLSTLEEYYDEKLLYVFRHNTLIQGYFALDKHQLYINVSIFEVLRPYRCQGLGSLMVQFIKSLIGSNFTPPLAIRARGSDWTLHRYGLSLSATVSSLNFWKGQGFQSYGQACYIFNPQTRSIQANITVTIRYCQVTGAPAPRVGDADLFSRVEKMDRGDGTPDRRNPWMTQAFEDLDGNLVFENDYVEYHPLDDIIDILINDDVHYHGRIKYLTKTLDEIDVKQWNHQGSTGFLAAGRHIFVCQGIHDGRRNLHLWQRKYGYAY
jgi:hypothetical protein